MSGEQEKNTKFLKRQAIFDDKNKKYTDQQQEEINENLKKAYLKIRKEYDELVEEELETDYQEVLDSGEENPFRKNLIRKGFEPPAMSFADGPMEKVNLKCGPRSVPMNFYISMAQSLTTEDREQLTHEPVLGGVEPISKEKRIELMSLYLEGIHGMARNWDRTEMNDWLLYKLMRKMLESYDFSENPDLFYYGIYRLWPNKWTQAKLSDGFPRLCGMFAEKGFDVEKMEPWKLEMVQTENEKEDKCYACLEYMCAIHGFAAKIPAEFPGGEFFKVEVELPDASDQSFCSSECWKKCQLDEAAEILKATDEEKQNLLATAYINKHRAVRAPVMEGLLAAAFGAGMDRPFCEFVELYLEEETSLSTCRAAYEFILRTVERPSAARLEMSKESKLLDEKTRVRNFRHHQDRLGKERSKENSLALEVPIVGCTHRGPCGTENCQCNTNGVCSHLCKCDVNCKMRFPGCSCGPGQCKSKSCQCYRARWECNPLTCKSCLCDDPLRKKDACSNFPMSKMRSKKLSVDPSKISGFGLYLKESVKKGDFIVEYVGERISHNEAERRGAIYDLNDCSYLFNLLTGGAIDATRAGNEARFANHSTTPNCQAQQVMVAGEERIGFFAKEAMEEGTELTFDYCYSKDHQKVFNKSSPKKGKKPASPQ